MQLSPGVGLCPNCRNQVSMGASQCPHCHVLFPGANPSIAPGNPDRIEWKTACFWWWVGLGVSCLFAAIAARYSVNLLTALRVAKEGVQDSASGIAAWGVSRLLLACILALLASALGISVSVLRLRRLYSASNLPPGSWHVGAVATALVVGLVIVSDELLTGPASQPAQPTPQAQRAVDMNVLNDVRPGQTLDQISMALSGWGSPNIRPFEDSSEIAAYGRFIAVGDETCFFTPTKTRGVEFVLSHGAMVNGAILDTAPNDPDTLVSFRLLY